MTKEKRAILPNKKKGIADSIEIKSALEPIAQKVWAERDFNNAKQLLHSHVEGLSIDESSKKRIMFTLNSITTKVKLDFYLANSILNYERLGVN